MLLPLGWSVCVSLLVPEWVPVPTGEEPRSRPVPVESAYLAAKLDRDFAAAAATLTAGPRSVLARIPNRERRRLAVAHYVRRRHEIDTLWTWSDAEKGAYRETDRHRRAMLEVRRVQRTFARLHPGHVLVTYTVGRSLRTQVTYWNRERSVAVAAAELQDSGRTWLADESFPDLPDSIGVARLLARLEASRPTHLPTVSVPGLSLHGQLRAFDFAVLRGGRVVAGTTSATIDSVWLRGGWAERLRVAVIANDGRFVGPLNAPPEPWHYEYRPETP